MTRIKIMVLSDSGGGKTSVATLITVALRLFGFPVELKDDDDDKQPPSPTKIARLAALMQEADSLVVVETRNVNRREI